MKINPQKQVSNPIKKNNVKDAEDDKSTASAKFSDRDDEEGIYG